MVFFKVLYERSSIIASFVVHPRHGIRLLSAKSECSRFSNVAEQSKAKWLLLV